MLRQSAVRTKAPEGAFGSCGLRAERPLRAESNLETPVETQADGAPLFRISDLSAGYDKKVVVEGVDLEVRAGDVVALIGPNGSGKSTILKTITRHLAPLAGAVELDGREISRWKTAEFARNLAVMLRSPPDRAPHLPRYRRGGKASLHRANGTLSPDDHSRVDEAMKTAHVEELAERDFMQISDGQRQRVMLARAIAQYPACARARRAHVVSRYPLPDRPAANTSPPCEIAECGCHHVHPRTRARAKKRRQGDLREGRPGSSAPAHPRTYHARDDRRALRPSTWHLQRALRQRGNWAPARATRTRSSSPAQVQGRLRFASSSGRARRFYAGVLHEGDIDCELARDLAAECVAERAFEPIGDKTIARAKELLVHCARLIVCPAAFGTINARNAELVEFARSHGIEVMRACEGASEDSQ